MRLRTYQMDTCDRLDMLAFDLYLKTTCALPLGYEVKV